ncbi:hypothetical protein RBB77_22085 [Tunturibacter psychrotolerans]|uniref:Apea-like HEPN domain-containing protein n=1 Tax=Tunturiibacter psychrotolerans TaxID=3069686 RepID=A0AAU7ZQ68_9BACT
MIEPAQKTEQAAAATPAQVPQNKSTDELLSDNANAFLLKLDALFETANRIMLIMMNSKRRAQENLHSYIQPLMHAKKGKTLTLNAGSNEYQEYLKLKTAREKAAMAERIVPQSLLISMVSQYDAFLVAATKNLFLLKPEKIRTAERTISVKDLAKFTSIEEVLQELIEDELDEVLRGSHLSQIQWVAKKFDFQVDPKEPLIEKFIEITERRNLCVHNEGLVSKQYKDKTKDLTREIAPLKELGEHLPINRMYLQQARDVLFETGIRTIQIAWRKIRPDQNAEQDYLLITIIFELLVREDYTLARNISDFGSSIRGVASEVNKLKMCINRAQAYKWSGKEEESKAIVNKIDWGASSANFRLAAAVINDDYESVAKLMEIVPKDGEDGIDAAGYRLWPLFKEIRKVPIFQKAFEAKFGEPLLAKKVDIPVEPIAEPVVSDGIETLQKPVTNPPAIN